MARKIFLATMICIGLAIIAACSGRQQPTSSALGDMDGTQTALVQTLVSMTQLATPVLLFTNTPTPEPTSIYTPTPVIPYLSVSQNTNCRSGPGKVYDQLGYLVIGPTAEIIARHPEEGSYWYIRNPLKPGENCWLWGKYATVSGNASSLPVFTPPPTPTPFIKYSVTYAATGYCVERGGWYLTFTIDNSGSLNLESANLYVKDNDTGNAVSVSGDRFVSWQGCFAESSLDRIAPGKMGVFSSNILPYNPAGHHLNATFSLCSQDALAGACEIKTVEFIP